MNVFEPSDQTFEDEASTWALRWREDGFAAGEPAAFKDSVAPPIQVEWEGPLILELPVPSCSRDRRRPVRAECTVVIKCSSSRRRLQHKPTPDMTDQFGNMELCEKL